MLTRNIVSLNVCKYANKDKETEGLSHEDKQEL